MSDQNAAQVSNEPKFTITLSGSYVSTVVFGIVSFLKARPVFRVFAAIIGLLTFLFGVLAFGGVRFFETQPIAFVFLLLGGGMLYVVTIAGPDFKLTFPTRQASEERKEAEKIAEDSEDPKDLLTLDFKRLHEYYVINQSQAKASFRWAIFALLLGFATIISGIWIFYLSREVPDTFMASLSTAAGMVVNLVSGLFLYLHQKTQERSLLYFQQLADVQRIGLALQLVNSYEDDQVRDNSRWRIVDHLLKASSEKSL